MSSTFLWVFLEKANRETVFCDMISLVESTMANHVEVYTCTLTVYTSYLVHLFSFSPVSSGICNGDCLKTVSTFKIYKFNDLNCIKV